MSKGVVRKISLIVGGIKWRLFPGIQINVKQMYSPSSPILFFCPTTFSYILAQYFSVTTFGSIVA